MALWYHDLNLSIGCMRVELRVVALCLGHPLAKSMARLIRIVCNHNLSNFRIPEKSDCEAIKQHQVVLFLNCWEH